MQMSFYTGTKATLWFQDWQSTTIFSYALGILGLIGFGILHEGLTCYRANYSSRFFPKPAFNEQGDPLAVNRPPRVALLDKLLLGALYTLNIATSYLLMLAVMTYNAGYFFAVLGGMGIGYVVFFDRTPAQALARSDSCHVRLIDAGQ